MQPASDSAAVTLVVEGGGYGLGVWVGLGDGAEEWVGLRKSQMVHEENCSVQFSRRGLKDTCSILSKDHSVSSREEKVPLERWRWRSWSEISSISTPFRGFRAKSTSGCCMMVDMNINVCYSKKRNQQCSFQALKVIKRTNTLDI